MASSDEVPSLTEALKHRLRVTSDRLRDLDLTPQQQLEVRALTRQVESGDVKGRRPPKTKLKEQAEFDARRLLKGMKSEEAMKRLELLVQRLAAEAVS
jgi:acyl-CoA-binding protein